MFWVRSVDLGILVSLLTVVANEIELLLLSTGDAITAGNLRRTLRLFLRYVSEFLASAYDLNLRTDDRREECNR